MSQDLNNQNSVSNQSEENHMDQYDMIKQLFNQYISLGGQPKVTSFKRHLDQLINDSIKPMCGGSSKSLGGTDWRSIQKSKFSGKGAKWIKVSVESLSETLDNFVTEGIDVKDYVSWIESAGYAWIRYAGPRVAKGIQVAAFEVRTSGSKIDHPKQLHYIQDAMLNDIERLSNTPHALKLEVSNDNEVIKPSDAKAVEPKEEKQSDVEPVEEKEVISAPESDNPEEWEAYLNDLGLAAEVEDEFDTECNDDLF